MAMNSPENALHILGACDVLAKHRNRVVERRGPSHFFHDTCAAPAYVVFVAQNKLRSSSAANMPACPPLESAQ